MQDYFKKLYESDPLFRALVLSRLQEGGVSDAEAPSEDALFMSVEDEIEILREYAITLFREHKNLKNMFLETLKVSGSSVNVKKPPQRASRNDL
jgi:hypothetical protein